jgi:hypothetical protein
MPDAAAPSPNSNTYWVVPPIFETKNAETPDGANLLFPRSLLLARQVDSGLPESQGRATSRELCPTAGEAPGLNPQLL